MASSSRHSQPRNLILCFDGTGNSYADENTNIVRLFSAFEKERTDKQLCYYQAGIGTYAPPNAVWSPVSRKVMKVLDLGLAIYLDAHIMGGYRFLMENYNEGDKIFLFGFSRGAYTARCLAGMLHKVGLLPKGSEEQVTFAYEKYTDTTKAGKIRAKGFKAAFSRSVCIEFIGVWDTVASVGWFFRHRHFTPSKTMVKTFRHALALDEHRAKFKPNPWHRAPPNAAAAKDDPDASNKFAKSLDFLENTFRKTVRRPQRRPTGFSDDPYDVEGEDDNYRPTQTDVRELWFAGCHADVGGGSMRNNVEHTLANPSLMWMVNELVVAAPDILFKQGAFADIRAFRTITAQPLSPITPTYLRPHIRDRDLEASDATAVGHSPPSTSGAEKLAYQDSIDEKSPLFEEPSSYDGQGRMLLAIISDDP
ncbi:hypothetical protein FRB99_003531, partial [Tulasnella sp. 403]